MQYNINESKTVMVTGATGLVGTKLVNSLKARGYTVIAQYHKQQHFNNTDLIWKQGDILDPVFLEEAMQDVDIVIHCAANVSFNPKQKHNLYAVNVDGTANIVNACLNTGIKRLVHISSVAALDRAGTDTLISDDLSFKDYNNKSEYGRTKFLGEQEVWRGIGEGLNAVILNPAIILGAGNWNKGSSELFKSVYKEFPWYTEGVNGFVDVQDVVKAIMLLLETDISAERFILAAENTSYRNLFNLIAAGFKKKPPYKKVTPFIASVVWRLEALKATFTKKPPMITKETAQSALSVHRFNNQKLKAYIPSFEYTPLTETVNRICAELISMNKLA